LANIAGTSGDYSQPVYTWPKFLHLTWIQMILILISMVALFHFFYASSIF
jgi:hypothetical protein